MARRAGATPVLLGYSGTKNPRVLSVQEEVPEVTSAPFVRASDRFAVELESRGCAALFIPDGHSTEAGYALLADETARPILALERR